VQKLVEFAPLLTHPLLAFGKIICLRDGHTHPCKSSSNGVHVHTVHVHTVHPKFQRQCLRERLPSRVIACAAMAWRSATLCLEHRAENCSLLSSRRPIGLHCCQHRCIFHNTLFQERRENTIPEDGMCAECNWPWSMPE